jgi:hypothetical protein
MTEARTCPSCAGTIIDGTICSDCLANLHHDLDTIGDHITELHTQLARQARHGDNGSGARSAERPLPYDQPASDATDLLRSVLAGWTRDLWKTHEHRNRITTQPPDTLRGMARYLRWHDWRAHPAADEFADELHYALDQIRTCIDTPPERRYLGPCGAMLVNPDGTTHECAGDVILVGNRMPKCRNCGASYFRDERLQWIADLAEDQLVTATIAAGALSAWGQHITPDLVRLWAHRGRLLPRGHDRTGKPVYSFGECRTLALASIKPKGRMNA